MKKFLGGLLSGILVSGLIFTVPIQANYPIALIVNHKEVVCDVPPQIVNDRLLVPVRAIAESLNCDVQYFKEGNAVYVTSKVENTPQTVPKVEEQTQNYTTQKYGNIEVTIKDSGIKLNSITSDFENYKIYGEVKNISTNTTYKSENGSLIEIYTTAYDSNDKVMATDISIPLPSTLEPGESSPFDIYFVSLKIKNIQADHYKIIIDSN
jgi:hypothetical protein